MHDGGAWPRRLVHFSGITQLCPIGRHQRSLAHAQWVGQGYMDSDPGPDRGIRQGLLRHHHLLLLRSLPTEAVDPVLLLTHFPIQGHEAASLGDHCVRCFVRYLVHPGRHFSVHSHQRELDRLEGHWRGPLCQPECHCLGQRRHQYHDGRVDARDPHVATQVSQPALEEEGGRGPHVLRRNLCYHYQRRPPIVLDRVPRLVEFDLGLLRGLPILDGRDHSRYYLCVHADDAHDPRSLLAQSLRRLPDEKGDRCLRSVRETAKLGCEVVQ